MFAALALPVFHSLFFFFHIGALPGSQQIPIDLVRIEVRAVDTGEFGLAAD
jgi:hypothetical protein